jgi:hypothetical protein
VRGSPGRKLHEVIMLLRESSASLSLDHLNVSRRFTL